MSNGDALWAGQLVAHTVSTGNYFLRRQLAQQDRRVEETNAIWHVHHAALVDRFNALAADHNALLEWAKAVAAERDAALARVAALEAQIADDRDKHARKLELAYGRADSLDRTVAALLDSYRRR